MQASHNTPEEALQVLADVRGRHLVPIHWGTFDLAEEAMEEPPARLLAEARRLGLGSERVWLMKHGAEPEPSRHGQRSEEHTSELQSRFDLVCRLLLEKK